MEFCLRRPPVDDQRSFFSAAISVRRVFNSLIISSLDVAGARSARCTSSIALTMIAMNKFSTANEVHRIKGMKNNHASGNCSITGLAIPIDHDSSVIIWKSENREAPIVPNQAWNCSPKSIVAMTEPT